MTENQHSQANTCERISSKLTLELNKAFLAYTKTYKNNYISLFNFRFIISLAKNTQNFLKPQ